MRTAFREAYVPSMPIARVLLRSHLTIAATYLFVYVLLDWISYVHPFAASGITPWNPQTGLSFALVLLFGIVTGTLSSIFIACPILLWLGVTKRDLMPKTRDKPELARRP